MKNSTVFTVYLQQWIKWIFVATSIIILVLLCYQLRHGLPLETNLQALFPQDKNNKASAVVNEKILHEFGNKLLIAVQAPTSDEVKIAADMLAQAITANSLLHMNTVSDNAELMLQQNTLLQQHHFKLLTPLQQTQLAQKQHAEILSHAQSALFGFNGGSSLSPTQDPLNLTPAYVRQLQPALNGELQNDRLVLADEKGQLILFPLDLQGESFNVDVQETMNSWLHSVREQLTKNASTQHTQVLVSGVVFHAADASKNAKNEMNVIGVGSTLGSVLIFLLTFFRIKPLLLSLASVAYGFALALAVNLLLFEKIHLMTLVFGASLIGVAIDYSVFYLCKHQAAFVPNSNQQTSTRIIQNLLPVLTLGLLTSIVGYACLLQPSLPGLQQIASFSVIGLCGSWLFVVATYPFFMQEPLPQPLPLINTLAFSAWRFWVVVTPFARWIFIGLALLIIAGFIKFQISSDVRTFYKPTAELLNSEQRLQQILQGVSPNQYFLVRAPDAESLLQAEEKFRHDQLDPLVAAGTLSAYTATSSIVPSLQQQQFNYQLMRTEIYADNALASEFMRSAGFEANAVQQAQQDFLAAENKQLSIDDWLKVARPDQRLLWLGKIDANYVSIIGLRGIKDASVLAAAENKTSVVWVNRIAEISTLLQSLTKTAAYLLLLAYAVTLVFLWIYYRAWKSLLLIMVPLLSTLLTLSILSLSGAAINLFHIFGCYLILGLGMDYSIFAYIEGNQDEVSRRSIWISAVSGALSFGLLALSSTPMVSAFGVTLLLGCFFNVLFSPLAGSLKNTHISASVSL